MEQTLAQKETALKAATEKLTQLDSEPKRRAARLDAIQASLPELRKSLEAVTLQEAELRNDATPAGQAKHAAAAARKIFLQRQIDLLEAERASYEKTAEWVQVQRDIAAASAKIAIEEEKSWRQLVNNRRQLEAQRKAEEAKKALTDASPALKTLAKEVQLLADQRAAGREYRAGLEPLDAESGAVVGSQDELRARPGTRQRQRLVAIERRVASTARRLTTQSASIS